MAAPDERACILAAMEPEAAADTLSKLSACDKAAVLARGRPQETAALLAAMDEPDRADAVGTINPRCIQTLGSRCYIPVHTHSSWTLTRH